MGIERREAIEPPKKHPVRKVVRGATVFVIGLVPYVGAPLAAAVNTLPSLEERELEQWFEDATKLLNSHERRLRKEIVLSGTTAALAEWLVRASENGLNDPRMELEEISSALGAEHPLRDVADAAHELQDYGLVKLSTYLGGGLVSPTWRLFAELDLPLMGWSTKDDAIALAEIALQSEDSFQLRDLEAKGEIIPRRRFNPAVSMMLSCFEERGLSQEIQAEYPTTQAFFFGSSRSKLRKFVAGT